MFQQFGGNGPAAAGMPGGPYNTASGVPVPTSQPGGYLVPSVCISLTNSTNHVRGRHVY